MTPQITFFPVHHLHLTRVEFTFHTEIPQITHGKYRWVCHHVPEVRKLGLCRTGRRDGSNINSSPLRIACQLPKDWSHWPEPCGSVNRREDLRDGKQARQGWRAEDQSLLLHAELSRKPATSGFQMSQSSLCEEAVPACPEEQVTGEDTSRTQ